MLSDRIGGELNEVFTGRIPDVETAGQYGQKGDSRVLSRSVEIVRILEMHVVYTLLCP